MTMSEFMDPSGHHFLDLVLPDLRRDVDAGCVQPFEAYASRVRLEDREALRQEYGVAVGLWTAGEPGADRGRSSSAVHTHDPDRIGPYRLLRQIGRGGQGVVHLARDERLQREVAVKVLHDSVTLDDDSLVRFRREAEAASRLDHSGVCAIHDLGVDGRTAYIAMRYVEGESLDRRIARSREGPLPVTTTVLNLNPSTAEDTEGATQARKPTDATHRDAIHPGAPATRDAIHTIVRLLSSAARTLHAAHEAGIVHRDMKPGNLMVTPADEVVVMDFGLAHLDDTDLPAVTRTGAFFGTPAYMSPEQLLAQRIRLDPRTDVWSLGVTLYECLTIHRPFQAATREGLYQAIQSKDPPPVRRLNPAVSQDLRAVVEVALQKDRDRRYQSAALFADDLDRILAGVPTLARPVGPAGRFLRWTRREPARASLLFLALVTLPLIATLLTIHVKDAPKREEARLLRLQQEKDAILSSASHELSEGSADRAVLLFAQVLAMEGGSPEAAGGLVLAHLRKNDTASASDALDRHGHLLAGTTAAVLFQADILRARGKSQDATALEASAPPPTTALDHHLLAERALTAGERAGDKSEAGRAHFVRAVRHATMALLLGSPRLLLYELRAHAAGHTKDRDAAVETAAALRIRWPGAASANYWAGFALGGLDDPPLHGDAIAAYREAIRIDPGFASAHLNLGGVFYAQGLLDEAIAACREAIRIDPGIALAHLNLGIALRDTGLLDDAIAAYKEAIRIDPGNAGAHFSLGVALSYQGLLDEAIASHREAIRIDPEFALAHYNLGVALFAQGLLDDAIAAYKEAIRIDPRLASAHLNLGGVFYAQGLHDDATAAYNEAIRIDPGLANAHYNLGNALRAQGLLDDAIAAFREAIRIDPGLAGAHNNLGAALYAQGLHDGAIAAFREAIRIDPGYAEAHCNLGHGLREAGRSREALNALMRGHEMGSRTPGWSHPSAGWVEEAERLVKEEEAEEDRLGDHLAKATTPDDPKERAALARAALRTGKAAVAVAWYQVAFRDDTDLAGNLGLGHRYSAACAAARAAAEASEPGEVEAMRKQALRWITEDLDAWQARIDKRRARDVSVRQALSRYLHELAFVVVRGDALAGLPEPQRNEWESLWKRVEEILGSL